MTRNRSRLRRRVEKQTKRNLGLSILGIVLVLFLLLKYGIPLLANFALFLSNPTNSVNPPNLGTKFVSSPQLNPLPDATNSAQLKVSGIAQSSYTIDLYLNDDVIDKTQADKSGNFSFDATLIKGANKIYTKSRVDKNVSDPSQIFNVIFKNTLPSLNINSPSDGQQFSKDQNYVNVSGSTDSNVKVTVNGFWAISDQNNNFSYQLPLQSGDNQIKIVAVDIAGNKTEKTIKVKYSP
ncbi:MAG TPA: hypothetical protein VKC89_01615 [Patescibacteria group bacterium]|nr:hypothetical protein [Patescibacteria group bacterium]